MINLKPTYKIEKSPEPPISWDIFEKQILSEWESLLNSNPPPSEEDIQHFLEKYPSLVPGAFNLIGSESGHYPRFQALISQPVLPSFDYRKPDFMWLSRNSAAIEPVLVEIESPGKRWWTDDGQQTAQLTQALDQIIEWKTWFDDPLNKRKFLDMYEVDEGPAFRRHFEPSFLLIFGRRSEANSRPSLVAKRNHLPQDRVIIRTYDGLNPNPKSSQVLCIKGSKNKDDYAFTVLSVPATLMLDPSFASKLDNYTNIEGAIEVNRLISPKRKKFLIERIPYWREWSKKTERCVINTGDKE
jgi:hypothetical protein